MKRFNQVVITIVLLSISELTAQAQKNSTVKTTKDTAIKVPATKMDKAQADADNYVRMAEAAKNKLKILFPSKAGDTVFVVIAGINYTDPNLKMLKQKIDEIKTTKGLTSSYHSNTAIVKIVYKDGNASKLYDNLSNDVKELFVAEDIEGSRIILTYKIAKAIESTDEKKVTDNTNQ